MVIEEINNSFKLMDPNSIDKDIKKIRQNIKIFGSKEKGGNKGVYEKIRTIHEDSFEDWENNIGFYLINGKVLGSTLYSTYIFKGSSFENPYKLTSDNKLKLKFQQLVFERIPRTLVTLERLLGFEEIRQPTIEPIKNELLRNFDVRSELFFNDGVYSITHQSMIFRLVLSLQELNYVKFVYLNFINKPNTQFLDHYYFARILTKNLDTVLKNLINISKYQEKDFKAWVNSIADYDLRCQIQDIFEHQGNLFKWIKKYRDMIHYDMQSPENNFLNFYLNESEDVFTRSKTVYQQILLPIIEGILNYIQVNKQNQYSLLKMLRYRRKIKQQRKKGQSY
ncbi:hypothetical protein [Shouchella clausii]|uniref:hypothetical protein n=1 Tax=Shouchella clausii TaxID=79880 RepID=UPI000BA5F545|nr:hypothetical protein [Shouchella clausii]PAD18613.1 hypothetical protein CHH73_04975 [Shouchella clausii]